jgi:leader peptidase (prepilin peptidase)/N-methyltransferase
MLDLIHSLQFSVWLEPLSHPYAWPILAMILGLCVGSFINVVAYRLPLMMEQQWQAELAYLQAQANTPAPNQTPQQNLSDSTRFNLCLPHSHCPACNTPLRWWHNIPCLSFLLLRGRCGFCQTKIGWQYPAIEAACAAWFLTLAWMHPAGWIGLGLMGFSAALISLAVIDFKTYLLPDDITLPALWAGLLFNMAINHIPLNQAVLGAALGYMVLWSIYWAFKWLTGKEGMGYGDFKLLAAIGAWFGVESLITVVLFASVSGIFFGLAVQAIRRQSRADPFPFGPCLVAGAFAWMMGLNLSNWL